MDVEKISANWTLTDINLIMRHSDLNGGNVTLGITTNENIGNVEITNSTWGHLNVSHGFNIRISDCYYTDVSAVTIPLIDVVLCNMIIHNSVFYLHPKERNGFGVLRSVSSNIQMVNITLIIDNNFSPEAGIQVTKESTLHMQNCSSIFTEYYSPMVSVQDKSEATFTNCTFSNLEPHGRNIKRTFNRLQGSECSVSENRSMRTDIKNYRNLLTDDNTDYAIMAAGSKIMLFKCTITCHDGISGQDYSTITAVGCTFNGTDLLSAINSTQVNFSSCTFIQLTGLIYLISNSSAYIDHSNMTAERIIYDTLIYLFLQSKVYIRNSNIMNILFLGPFVCVQTRSTFVMANCSYTNNTVQSDYMNHFTFSGNSIFMVQNSTFYNNSGYKPLIDMTSGIINLHGMTFQGPIFMEANDIHLEIDSCQINCKQIINIFMSLSKSVFKMKNSTFDSCQDIYTGATTSESNSYVSVENSTFRNTSLVITHIADVNMYDFNLVINGAVHISTSTAVTTHLRMANSHLFGSVPPLVQNPVLYFDSIVEDTIDFKTLNTIFSRKNSSITSSIKNFVERGEKEGFIKVDPLIITRHTETAYASSKYEIRFILSS